MAGFISLAKSSRKWYSFSLQYDRCPGELPVCKSNIRLLNWADANLLNHRYIQYAGGPTLGAIYYVAVTVDGLLQ